MRGQLRFLTERSPVLLEPALRFGTAGTGCAPLQLAADPESRILLTFSGTGAIYQAAAALALRATDRVLLPAYNCGHEIEPVLRAGGTVDFYRVQPDLRVDVDDLAARLDTDVRAVLVTHYFGMPQDLAPIRALCAQHGAALIEDCAHALFSRAGASPVGAAGDFAVYSLRKSLPLPHGGALVSRGPYGRLPERLPRPPRLSTAAKLLERYQKGWLMPARGAAGRAERAAFIATRVLAQGARACRDLGAACGGVQFDPDDESYDFPAAMLGWGVAPSVEQSLGSVCADAIVARRRDNYAAILASAERFVGCRPLLGALPDGVCPLYFPILAEDSDEVVERLYECAVSAVQWWGQFHDAVAWSDFPEAARLKRDVVVLPVHQDLGEPHIDRIVAALSRGG